MTAQLEVNLDGMTVALTGGGGVLCGTMARALAAEGAAVGLVDVREEAAQEVADEIRGQGGKALPLQCDVLERSELREAADELEAEFGPVDALINGAGGNKAAATTTPELPFDELPEEAVRWVFELNFMGTFLASQVFGGDMARRESGNIINVSSMTALSPLTRIPAYSAAKSAVTNFTRWLSVHLNRNYGPALRVNAIAPGFFLTEQNRYLLTDEETGELTPRGQTIIDHTPMGRFGDPEDLIGTVLWLLSDSSAFVNGIVVPVDGGFSAFSGV